MSKTKRITPSENYGSLLDGDVVSRATAVETGMSGNSNFPNPPVALADLKAANDTLSALIAEALDGSKKVIAEKKKQREVVIKMLRLLGHYVEFACKDDLAIFNSSGFQAVSTTRTPPQQLSDTIRSIDHGANSGQIVVLLKAVPKAFCYEVRHAALNNGGMPGPWMSQPVTGVRTPVTVSGLTPGTPYAFQVRALLQSGYSDWSDSATCMCT